MYGLVNQGVRKMVTDSFGEKSWATVLEAAGVEDVFVAMDPYPDEVTFKLVAAASTVLELEPKDVLAAFGRWWIGFASEEYSDLFKMTGDSFQEFVANLNDIHTRVGYMLTDLSPPSFKITDSAENTFVLHYYSKREGLFPMVQGMINGIGDHFKTEIEVEHMGEGGKGPGHDRYLVRHKPCRE